MNLGFSGRHVVITGGTSGIGLAIADAFAEAGAHVGVIGRSSERQQSAVAALEEGHPDVRIVGMSCDVTDEGALRSTMQEVVSRVGGLDHLVSSAGISGSQGDSVEHVTSEEFINVQRVNVLGPFLALKAALPYLRNGQDPTYTLLGSDSGFVAAPGMLAYNASKGAIVQLTRALSTELYQDGIRVNSVCPSIVDTPMSRNGLGVESFENAEYPVSRPADIAWLALTLASPRSCAVNGVSLLADYGFHARSSYPA